MAILEIELKNLKELAAELDAFHPESDGWNFRGQANELWQLTPSIWRNNIPLFEKLQREIPEKNIVNIQNAITKELARNSKLSVIDINTATQWALRVKFENWLLAQFYLVANETGLAIPENQHRLCQSYNGPFWMKDSLENIGSVFSFYASRLDTGKPTHRIGGPISFDGMLSSALWLTNQIPRLDD